MTANPSSNPSHGDKQQELSAATSNSKDFAGASVPAANTPNWGTSDTVNAGLYGNLPQQEVMKAYPTWLEAFAEIRTLCRYDVGTGQERLATIGRIVEGIYNRSPQQLQQALKEGERQLVGAH